MTVKGRLIPVPNLDDRDWRTIKNEMIQAIPKRTPEWTNHNLSDPGITLVEAFALQIEQLIVRLNQVLPKHMREYLNMIGVTLTPPSSAKALCFFQTTVKPTFDITVLSGFEVATSHAGSDKPVVFTTDKDLVIHTAQLKKVLADQGGSFVDFTDDAKDSATTFDPLPTVAVEDALYFAYNEDNYFEQLFLDIETGALDVLGVWECFTISSDGTSAWETLGVEDGTSGFTQTGAVTFKVPVEWEATSVDGVQGTWLRYRITQVEPGGVFAMLRECNIDNILGRVVCSHAARVSEEILGSSDNVIDQRFFLSKAPVVDLTVVVDEGSGFEAWIEVDDFFESAPDDKHYMLNKGTGEVLFGDGRHGKIPGIGTGNVRAKPYRYGGGLAGNVGANTITHLRTTHPFISSVTNKEAASGGDNEETIEEALVRGPIEVLRTRNRAITAEDFETLVLEGSLGVARAKTLPLFDPANPAVPKPGLVSVIVLPAGGAPLSEALRGEVRAYLDARRLLTTQIYVIEVAFVPVDFTLSVVKTPESSATDLDTTIRSVIREYYDPEFGNDPAKAVAYIAGTSIERGSGWAFGRNVFRSEIFELLERIPGVDHVESITEPAATVLIEEYQLPEVRDLVVSVT